MNKKLLILPLLILVFLTGCSLTGNTQVQTDGGVWKSTDNGRLWQQRSAIAVSSGPAKSFVNLDSIALVMDPADHNALYYGSIDQGLFYSYDGGAAWQIATGLGPIPIGSIAVDPNDKCTVYVASVSKIKKTTDCSRNWQEMYADNDPGQFVNSIVVDQYNSQVVYMGNERGDIIRSNDGGDSWQTLHNFAGRVRKIVLSPTDSRVIFVLTENKGLFRSNNNGVDWLAMEDLMKGIRNTKLGRDLTASKTQPGTFLYATKYGMLRTVNNGDDWTEITLLVPKNESQINSVVISDQDVNKIYYATDTVFYSSNDSGVNWTSQDLPTTRRGANIVVDPVEANTVYFAPISTQQ
jgi:photosystem II stability/assembly factor-like uncharacterized protein